MSQRIAIDESPPYEEPAGGAPREYEREVQLTDQERERTLGSAVDSSLAVARSRVELDQSIATARAYPRSLKKFVDGCMEMATLNAQVAGECIYTLPARKGGDEKKKPISGPSARLAEIVASSWGNCRVGARVVDEGSEFITAQGVFHDLERNYHVSIEVRRRITGKYGRYNADMIGVTGNAACSIALRNSVFKGVPKALWSGVYLKAREAALGKGTLEEKRADALKYAADKYKVGKEQLLAALGIAGVEDLGLEELADLRGLFHAINEGEVTVADAFAPKEPPAEAAASNGAGAKGMAGLAARAGVKAEPKVTPPSLRDQCIDLMRVLRLGQSDMHALLAELGIEHTAETTLGKLDDHALGLLAPRLAQEAAQRGDGGPTNPPPGTKGGAK